MPGNPYTAFVADVVGALARAAALPKGGLPPAPAPPLPADAPTALVLAPHPDDECIIGGLPLRLRRAGVRVVDLAVTLGSNRDRRPGRRAELEGACEFLGFELALPAPDGLDRVTPAARAAEPAHWAASVDAIAAIIDRVRPAVLFLPHAADWNQTHIGTHHLGHDALARAGVPVPRVIETEFWGAMARPNLMVESTSDELADLCAATSFHVGEVARNPYHLSLPGWMIDNVRRGGELVGGQGGAAPSFTFATLYRLLHRTPTGLTPAPAGHLAAATDPRTLLP